MFTYDEELVLEAPELLASADLGTSDVITSINLVLEISIWMLHADGVSNSQGSGAGHVLITPEANMSEIALKFLFKASNNESEYKAIIAGLRIAANLGAKQMVVYNDYTVVIGQILGHNMAKEDHMAAYLVRTQAAARRFTNLVFIKVLRAQNNKADRLAKLASSLKGH